jgi:hypothetical protein
VLSASTLAGYEATRTAVSALVSEYIRNPYPGKKNAQMREQRRIALRAQVRAERASVMERYMYLMASDDRALAHDAECTELQALYARYTHMISRLERC